MKQMIYKLFINTKKKNVFLWTTLSGGTISASSVIILLVLTRVLGLTEAGIYSIALSVSQQLSSIGSYSIRTFHSSDIKKIYTFNDYKSMRILTCAAMLLISVLWIFLNKYDMYKACVVLALCMYKMFESYCDLYEGTYQRNDRFDISGKSSFIKEFTALITALIVIYIFHNLFLAMLLMGLIYLFLFFVIDGNIINYFEKSESPKCTLHNVWSLLILGLPIVVNSYLMLYINNSSKYAIDRYCNEEAVTIFNILYMPAFCINLLVEFIARPMITELAKKVENKQISGVKKILSKEVAGVLGVMPIIIVGMYFVGLRILEVLYAIDLQKYKLEMIFLLLGGTFYAIYTIFYYMITILRKQSALLVSCGVGSVLTMFVMAFLVKKYAILGASIGYAIIMFFIAAICMFFVILYLSQLTKDKKEVTII